MLIRPGHYDSYGHYSTGESHAFDCHGYPCDSYQNKTVNTLAAAVKQLKHYYQPKCTILIGHSGVAFMSSIILGKDPNLVQGAVKDGTHNSVVLTDTEAFGKTIRDSVLEDNKA